MLAIQRILFPTDYSVCAEEALGHALAFAWLHQAELHILTADINIGLEDQLADPPSSHLFAQSEIGTATVPVTRVHYVNEDELVAANASTIIVDYARKHEIDLIVMGTHGHRGLKRLILGSDTERVVREAPCPVLTLKCKEDVPYTDGDRIVVPVDFSEPSRLAISYAEHLARALRAGLDLVHIVSEAPWPAIYGFEASKSILTYATEQSKEELENLALPLRRSGLDVQLHIRAGYPTTEILTVAQEQRASLVLMPTHGLTGLKHLLIGSVAEKVVRMSPCPVFVIKPYGKTLLPDIM